MIKLFVIAEPRHVMDRNTEPPILGIAELWFDSREEADRAMASPELETAMADAANCLDLETVIAGWAEEYLVI